MRACTSSNISSQLQLFAYVVDKVILSTKIVITTCTYLVSVCATFVSRYSNN